MDKTQPLRPHTLWQRLCARFHREPVTYIPHADTARPEDLPQFDLEATWGRIEAVIDDVAFGRSLGTALTGAQGNLQIALDSAHGDLVDRLIVPIIGAYKADLDQAQGWRLETSRMHLNQRVQHLTERSLRADSLRAELARYYAERDEAWIALGGAVPAKPVSLASTNQAITVRPLPVVAPGAAMGDAALGQVAAMPRTLPKHSGADAALWASGTETDEGEVA